MLSFQCFFFYRMTLPFLGIIGLSFMFVLLFLFFVFLLCAWRPKYRERIKEIINEYRKPKHKHYKRRSSSSRHHRPVSDPLTTSPMHPVADPQVIMHSSQPPDEARNTMLSSLLADDARNSSASGSMRSDTEVVYQFRPKR